MYFGETMFHAKEMQIIKEFLPIYNCNNIYNVANQFIFYLRIKKLQNWVSM